MFHNCTSDSLSNAILHEETYSCPTLWEFIPCKKSIQPYFFAKTWGISMKHACMRRSWTFIRMHDFFPVCRWRQTAYEWGNVWCYCQIFIVKKVSNLRPLEFGEQPEVAGHHIRRVKSLANHRSLVFCQKSLNQVQEMCWSIVVMEAPIACWPQLRSLTPHSIT